MTTFSQLLRPPLFDDAEKNHIAPILHYFLIGGITLALIGAPILFAIRANLLDMIACVVAIANNLVLLGLLRHGRVRTVAYLSLLAFWGLNTLFPLLQEGLLATPLYGYFVVIPFAGFLLGWHAGFYMTLLCIVSGYLIAAAQKWSLIDAPGAAPFDPIFHWTSATIFLILAFFVQYFISLTLQRIGADREKELALRLKAEEERRLMEERLLQNERLYAIGTLAGGIAHDFNNILTGILGNADLLARRSEPDSPYRRPAESIRASAERGAGLVKQILSFSRPKNTRIEPTHLQRTLTETIAMLRPLIPPAFSIEQELDPSCPPVLIDPTHFHQIVTNLTINSYQSMQERGHGRIWIALCCGTGPADGTVTLSVADDGPGIAPEHREKIFDPFFTTKSNGEGTGLGLSIINGLVTRYDGTIRVESTVGQGSRFIVDLPVTVGVRS